MANLKNILTSKALEKDYHKWLKENPEAINDNRIVLKEIGNLLNKEIPKDELFYEAITVSPSDYRTKQIVIRANPDIIQLIDDFLLKNEIVACKEATCLRIDC